MDMTVQQLFDQLAEWIIYYGKVAGGLSAIIGVLVLILKPKWKAYNEKRKQKEDEQAAQNAEVKEALTAVKDALKSLTDDVASLQMDRLDQAHDFYTAQGWIDSRRLQMMGDWYKSYTSKGHNHLVEHWLQDLEELPSSPPKNN